MPTLSVSLDRALHNALQLADERRHEYATLEHLLLALLDDDDTARILRACSADVDELKKPLEKYVAEELGMLVNEKSPGAKPTTAFQRVVQRAVIHVQNSGREQVGGENVLGALFSERDSPALTFLQERGISRLDIVKHIADDDGPATSVIPGTQETGDTAPGKRTPGLMLSIDHPEADLSLVAAQLGLPAFRSCKKGDPHVTTDRRPTGREHQVSHCSFQFARGYDQPVQTGMRAALAALTPHRQLFVQLSQSGATMKFFIGSSAPRGEDDSLDWTVLRDLSDLGISLDLGPYRG